MSTNPNISGVEFLEQSLLEPKKFLLEEPNRTFVSIEPCLSVHDEKGSSEFDVRIDLDDETHQHNKLGKKTFSRKADKTLKVKYDQFKSKTSKITINDLLHDPMIRSKFEEFDYSSIRIRAPQSFANADKIKKVAIFKYRDGYRCGGILGSDLVFYIFWIDHADNQLYRHIS